MTARELIKVLSKLDEDTEVLINGHDAYHDAHCRYTAKSVELVIINGELKASLIGYEREDHGLSEEEYEASLWPSIDKGGAW